MPRLKMTVTITFPVDVFIAEPAMARKPALLQRTYEEDQECLLEELANADSYTVSVQPVEKVD